MRFELLRHVPLFRGLTMQDLERIAELMVPKKFKRNNLIIFEDDLGQNLFIIDKGRVKVSGISNEGGEAIFAILGEGDFFGELSIIDGLARSATVTSIEDVELWVLNRNTFLDLIDKYPSMAIELLKELAARIRKSDAQIKSLTLKDARGRVANTLIRMAEDIGSIRDGRVVIQNLPLQRDVANLAGTSRETISRLLSKFEEEGLIRRSGSSLIFNDFEEFKRRLR
ncbi:MAG: Crp/Fnr family transcriptional regulator [bacterium]|nr:Crp/Fnr family transcriptional regulator [bacterium]